ncbi:hypothetical protein [Halalkalibacter sp. APA_J-10(15)]|nr:hypothetical protein [Halalkalibacter sp. APA_J-10(15)]
MSILFALLKDGGVMVLCDFHPLRRCTVKGFGAQIQYEIQPNTL